MGTQQRANIDGPPPADHLRRRFIWLVALTSLAIYVVTYASACFGPSIRADGVGYYSYLPAIVIDGDPSFRTLAAREFGGAMPHWAGFQFNAATDAYMNKFNCGVALLMSPFFLAAHAVAKFSGGCCAPTGYTFPYQHAAGLAGWAFFVAALYVLWLALRRFYDERAVALGLLALVFGTNLLHYGSGETVLSHPYSFFFTAVLLWLVPIWQEREESLKLASVIGVALGLLLLIRATNIFACLFIALYGVKRLSEVPAQGCLLASRWRSLGLMAILVSLVLLPQMVFWKMTSGSLLVNSYGEQGEGFHFLHPHLWGVLFSPEKGILLWFPVLAMAISGFVSMRNLAREWRIAALAYMAASLYLIACWFFWQFGGGFGHRAFVESYAVLAFPLTAFVQSVRSSDRRGVQRLAVVLAVVCILWTLFLMKLFYTREIPFSGPDWQAVYDIFWLRAKLAWGMLR